MTRHTVTVGPLLVLLLVVGAVAADEAEDRAIATIKKLGGKFERDEKKADKPVVRVDIARKDVASAALRELAALKQLQTLFLDGAKVTDAGLKELAGLTQLQTLGVALTEVTDAGVGELQKALPRLRIER